MDDSNFINELGFKKLVQLNKKIKTNYLHTKKHMLF